MPDDDFYHRLPVRSRLRLRWHQRARTWQSAAAVLLVLVAAGIMTAFLPRDVRHNVSGTVRCLSGRPVVGVYAHDAYPRSGGWARLSRDPNSPARVRYQRDDVRGSTHWLSVGCGGAPDNWATALDTPEVDGEHHDFLCLDRIGDLAGVCEVATTQ